MKLTFAQALATVLNIQQNEKEYFRLNKGVEQPLGKSLHNAIIRAWDLASDDDECNFAIFPIGSDRGEIYMQIERHILQQEAFLEPEKKIWEHFSPTDPRDLVTTIMGQLRNCATYLVAPDRFRLELLRTGCLIVAGLQWCDAWISRLKIRGAAIKSLDARDTFGTDQQGN